MAGLESIKRFSASRLAPRFGLAPPLENPGSATEKQASSLILVILDVKSRNSEFTFNVMLIKF